MATSITSGVKSLTTTRALLVRVCGRACALPLAAVAETMRPLPTQAMAGAPAYVRGAALVRGVPTPVVDLGLLLGGTASEPRRFVRMRIGDRSVALAVEDVLGVHTFEASDQALPPLLRGVADTTIGSLESLDHELLWILRESVTLPDAAWPSS
jgi:purine-binding chemotaxis protein CheW